MIENEEEILNIPNNKSKINEVSKRVDLRINFISNNIQVNSPKTDSHLISIDNRHKNKDSEIKADSIIKKSNNKNKYQAKTNNNKLIISSEEDKDINQNEEVYLYYNNINPKINKSFNQNILLYFILSRINENKTLKCNILLKNNNYILYSNSGKFMLSAKEDFSFFHKNFEIYTSRDFSNSSIIARLHSYSRNTEFILYDKGISPYKNKNIVGENKQKLRRYLMQIKYLNDKKFMHFLVYLPKDNIFLNKNFNIDKNHKDKLNNKTLNETMIFENSMPKFDFYLKTFVDNFSDRVKEKSKFNFKIINEGKKAIEFGKVNNSNFILDINYPFSPLEAFAIAISIFNK